MKTDFFGLKDFMSAFIRKARGLEQPLMPKGKFQLHHIRDGKVIGKYDFPNGITNVGKDSILNVHFRNQTQIPSWYIGLVDNASFSAFAAADTMSSHAGWIETVAYTEATRNAWTPAAPSGQAITNTTPVTFTINATVAIKGIFITSGSAKSGTAGTLWSTGAFPAVVNAVNLDQLMVVYTLTT